MEPITLSYAFRFGSDKRSGIFSLRIGIEEEEEVVLERNDECWDRVEEKTTNQAYWAKIMVREAALRLPDDVVAITLWIKDRSGVTFAARVDLRLQEGCLTCTPGLFESRKVQVEHVENSTLLEAWGMR